jgi:PPP family 3-phenylpropionic acid transporter
MRGFAPIYYCCVWYFIFCGGLAVLIPYLPVIFKHWQLTPSQIGIIAACKPLIGFCIQPIWGQIADYTKLHSQIHAFCLFASACGYGSLYFQKREFGTILAHVLLTEMFGSGGFFLADNATNFMVSKHLERDPGSSMSYGKVRLWGAVGWGYVFAPLMGLVLTEEKNAQYAPFLAYVILFSMASAVALRMEHHEKEVAGEGDDAEIVVGNDDEGENERMMGGASNTSSDTRRLLMALSMALTDTYLFLHLESLGAPPILMGLALFFTCVAEVPVFFHEKKIKEFLGLDRSMLLILVAYVFRQLGYASLKSFGSPWFVLPLQLLHGITFGLYWSVGVEFSRLLAPEDLRAAVMGFFSGMNSLGAFLGAICGGRVYDRVGGGGLFFIAAVGNTILSIVFALKMTFGKRVVPTTNSVVDNIIEIDMSGFVRLENPPSSSFNDGDFRETEGDAPGIDRSIDSI